MSTRKRIGTYNAQSGGGTLAKSRPNLYRKMLPKQNEILAKHHVGDNTWFPILAKDKVLITQILGNDEIIEIHFEEPRSIAIEKPVLKTIVLLTTILLDIGIGYIPWTFFGENFHRNVILNSLEMVAGIEDLLCNDGRLSRKGLVATTR